MLPMHTFFMNPLFIFENSCSLWLPWIATSVSMFHCISHCYLYCPNSPQSCQWNLLLNDSSHHRTTFYTAITPHQYVRKRRHWFLHMLQLKCFHQPRGITCRVGNTPGVQLSVRELGFWFLYSVQFVYMLCLLNGYIYLALILFQL